MKTGALKMTASSCNTTNWRVHLLIAGSLLAGSLAAQEYAVSAGPDQTLGLWSVWETGANEVEVELRIHQLTATPEPMQLWNLELGWDDSRLEAIGDPTEGDAFDGLSNSYFNFFGSAGSLTVTGVLLGLEETAVPSDGALLFKQRFHALDLAGGLAEVSINSIDLRDGANQAIAGSIGTAAGLTIDVTAPEAYQMSLEAFNPLGNEDWTSQELIQLNTVEGDGSLLSWQVNEIPLLIPNTDPAWLSLPFDTEFTLTSGDGLKTVYLHLRDQYGNRTSLQDAITLDTQAPIYHVTQFDAESRHERVNLSWRNPTAPDFDRVRVWRGNWEDGLAAYPEYDDQAEMDAYPQSESEALAAGFTLIYEGALESAQDLIQPRDVYRYVAFAVDHAGNVGPGDDAARDRSANYILGDVYEPVDGRVFARDLIRLSMAYYTTEGHVAYNPNLDIGPTDDTSREGVPLTDNTIGFEDLMIFAMNYGQYGPTAMEADSLRTSLEVGVRIDGTRSVVSRSLPADEDN
jgi:hypothetical protein